jgi:hypothetical protein
MCSISSPDAPNLQSFVPEVRNHFCLRIEAEIGPRGGHGHEVFAVEVCTPQWLADRVAIDGYLCSRHYLDVQEYNYGVIRRQLERLLTRLEARDWEALANKIG